MRWRVAGCRDALARCFRFAMERAWMVCFALGLLAGRDALAFNPPPVPNSDDADDEAVRRRKQLSEEVERRRFIDAAFTSWLGDHAAHGAGDFGLPEDLVIRQRVMELLNQTIKTILSPVNFVKVQSTQTHAPSLDLGFARYEGSSVLRMGSQQPDGFRYLNGGQAILGPPDSQISPKVLWDNPQGCAAQPGGCPGDAGNASGGGWYVTTPWTTLEREVITLSQIPNNQGTGHYCNTVTRFRHKGPRGTLLFQALGGEKVCETFALGGTGDATFCSYQASCQGPTLYESTEGHVLLELSGTYPGHGPWFPGGAKVRFPDGTTEYFEESGYLNRRVDRNGNVWRYEYAEFEPNEWGLNLAYARKEIDPSGRVTLYRQRKELLWGITYPGRIEVIEQDGPGGQKLVTRLHWKAIRYVPEDVLPQEFRVFAGINPNEFFMCTNDPGTSLGPYGDVCPGARFLTLERVDLPDGSHHDFEYNGWGGLTRVSSPKGAVIEYEYGNPTTDFIPPATLVWPEGPYSIALFEYIAQFFRQRLTAMHTYPMGLGGPKHTVRYVHESVETLSNEYWPGRCQRVGWFRTEYPAENGYQKIERAGVCYSASRVSMNSGRIEQPNPFLGWPASLSDRKFIGDPTQGRTIASEVWERRLADGAERLLTASYYGNTGRNGDATTALGTMYYQWETASKPDHTIGPLYGGREALVKLLRTASPLNVRNTRIVHLDSCTTGRDGCVSSSEELSYDSDGWQVDAWPDLPPASHTRGNVVRHRLLGPGGTLLKETRTGYMTDGRYVDKDLIHLPKTVEIFDGAGALLARTDSAYDQYDASGAEGAGAPVPAPGASHLEDPGPVRGNATTLTSYKDPSHVQGPVSTKTTYFATGTVESTADPRGNRTTTSRSFADCSPGNPRVTTTATNALGHPVTTVSDCYTGAVLSVTDANGARTCTQYDRIGRGVAVAGPGESLMSDASLVTDPACSGGTGGPGSWTEYPPLGAPQIWTISHTKDGTGDGHQTRTFMDGLGRKIQTCTEVDATVHGHGWICDRVEYDSMGRTSGEFVPFYADNVGTTSIPPAPGTQLTKTTYDALGRPLSSELVGPTGQSFYRTLTSYETAQYAPLGGGLATGFLTIVRDPNGHRSQSITNLLGHLVETKKEWGGCPGGFCVTKMMPDALGRASTIQDAIGNITSLSYDGLGRKIEMSDPDMGRWKYKYDDNGNPTEQIDAKGQVTTMQYDRLNRLTLQDNTPEGPGEEDVTNTYDGEVPSTCYSCNDWCSGTIDRCNETTKTCTHEGEPCDAPNCVPIRCSNPGVMCSSASVPDGCGGTITCCNGSGCTPVTCTGCQTTNTCGDACVNLSAGSEGNCAACQDCDGNGNCAFVSPDQQDVGCDAGPTGCSGADKCNGVGICMSNDLPAGAEGACPTCQDCDGNGNCAYVPPDQQDVGCDAPAGSCTTRDVCNGGGSCSHRDTDRLTSEMGIHAEESVYSCDGRFRLLMQGAGNLVLYGPHGAMWATPTVGTGANFALMQSDGNFVIYSPYAAVWTSNTWMYPGAWLIVQNDGNLVIYTQYGYPVWASNTVLNLYCGDGYCDPPETVDTCLSDCGFCGDGHCSGSENSYNCPGDCGDPTGFCGDGYCDRNVENEFNCQQDCGYPPPQ